MALKNYTTVVPVMTTLGKIMELLAAHNARKIMFEYADNGSVKAVCFSILTPHGEQGVKLPGNAEKVKAVLHRQKADPKTNPKTRAAINDTAEQAERVAWRIVNDWLSAQMAILETEMVEAEQIYLPYFVNREGETLYEVYQEGRLALSE